MLPSERGGKCEMPVTIHLLLLTCSVFQWAGHEWLQWGKGKRGGERRQRDYAMGGGGVGGRTGYKSHHSQSMSQVFFLLFPGPGSSSQEHWNTESSTIPNNVLPFLFSCQVQLTTCINNAFRCIPVLLILLWLFSKAWHVFDLYLILSL
jgi:hypothetical protein